MHGTWKRITYVESDNQAEALEIARKSLDTDLSTFTRAYSDYKISFETIEVEM
jgi:hypothetical protein